MRSGIKSIGSSGQISLGKRYGGRTVVVDELEQGVWLVKTAQVIPDNDRWLHTPVVKKDLDEALAWASRNPPAESDLPAMASKVKGMK